MRKKKKPADAGAEQAAYVFDEELFLAGQRKMMAVERAAQDRLFAAMRLAIEEQLQRYAELGVRPR